jgi:hypothetical protein
MNGTYAILTTLTRRAPRFDQLGGTPKTPESTTITRTILANSWDIQNPEKLRSTLAWLRKEGHRAGRPPSPNDNLGPRGLLAWDLVRVIAVAGWGYVADYISEDEAWSHIGPAAVQLRQAYQSWEDLQQAYVNGAFAWDASAGPDCQQKYQQIMADPSSPWRAVPWATDLGTWSEPSAPSPLNVAAGTLDVGGGQIRLKIDGKTPENFVKDKVSSMIWGWVIGGVILIVALIGLGGLGLYVYLTSKSPPSSASAKAGKWDGKTTFECGGNDVITLSGVTATVSGTAVKAMGNCQLTLTGVSITAAVGIDASGNAKVNMAGGSINATTNSAVATAGAHVTCVGTKVTGKSKASGAATVTGAN